MRYYTRIHWEDEFDTYRRVETRVESAGRVFAVDHVYDTRWLKQPGYVAARLNGALYELWKLGAFDAAIVDACATKEAGR